MKKYWHVQEYLHAWDQGRAELKLSMLLEHGPLTAQQQFHLLHQKHYEIFTDYAADLKNKRSNKP